MVKCSICGEQVELRKENRYEVVIEAGTLQKSFGAKDQLYEAFDCPHCGCQMLMQERFPAKDKIKIAEDELKSEGTDDAKDKTSKFRDKVKITYGPEKREADDVTLDYLQKMSDDELLAFCGENDIRIPDEYRNRGYLISIIKKHCLVQKEWVNSKMEYKLGCFGQWEDTARCGMCPDEGTCECETKWNNEIKGESNCKNERK